MRLRFGWCISLIGEAPAAAIAELIGRLVQPLLLWGKRLDDQIGIAQL